MSASQTERVPTVYKFTDSEALIMSRCIVKPYGNTVSGGSIISVARNLASLGFVKIEETTRNISGGSGHHGGLIIRPTRLGREAWQNAGLIAAGRKPVCL